MAVELDGIRFVVAPGKYPPRLPFVVVRDDRLVPETVALIRAFAPHAPFQGYVAATVRPEELDPSAVVLVSSPDWPRLVARLRRQLAPGRIAVLLNPGDYPWGYLAVARAAPDHVSELADPAVSVEMKIVWLRRYLARHAYVTFEGDQPLWYPDCYFAQHREQVRANAAVVHDVFANLADQESRDAYNLVLYGRPEDLLQRFLGRVFREQQYVEMTRLRPGDVIVNAGVADGWDIPYLLAQTRGRGRHLLVDPTDGPPGSPAVTLRGAFGLDFTPAGLWDRAEGLEFPIDDTGMIVGTKPGEALADRPTARVRCAPLDALVREWGLDRLDLVKMDIEGAEPRALDGMRDSLRRFRPQVAVCIYHQPDHMWTIPAKLVSWLTDYRFFVRHYSPVRFECVFYAIPVERLPAEPSGDPILDATGVDGRLLRRAWEAADLGTAFAAAAEVGAVRAAAAEIDRAMTAAPADPPLDRPEVLVGGPDFIGTGWGPAGWNQDHAWRWIGPDGTASVFLSVDRSADLLCRLYLHHADAQEVFDRTELDVDGTAGVDRSTGKEDGRYYLQWRVPAAPDKAVPARARISFRSVAGPKRVAVYKVSCRRVD